MAGDWLPDGGSHMCDLPDLDSAPARVGRRWRCSDCGVTRQVVIVDQYGESWKAWKILPGWTLGEV